MKRLWKIVPVIGIFALIGFAGCGGGNSSVNPNANQSSGTGSTDQNSGATGTNSGPGTGGAVGGTQVPPKEPL